MNINISKDGPDLIRLDIHFEDGPPQLQEIPCSFILYVEPQHVEQIKKDVEAIKKLDWPSSEFYSEIYSKGWVAFEIPDNAYLLYHYAKVEAR